jgi:hypothetical protein
MLVDVVLPNWVKRCGAQCGEAFNASVAPHRRRQIPGQTDVMRIVSRATG